METVDVLLSGNILPGTDLAAAAEQLSGLTGLTKEQAQALISSGKERVVKRGVSAAVGQRYVDKFTAMGIEARLHPNGEAAASMPLAADAQPAGQSANRAGHFPSPLAANTTAPDTADADLSRSVVRGDDDLAEQAINPYSAPKAAMDERHASYGSSWRDSPTKVPASHGYRWFKDAWSLFSAQKGTWIGAILLLFFISTAVSAVLALASPLLSNIATNFLWPLFAGGIAVMAHRQSEGEAIGVLSILAGFKQNTVQLLLIGLFALMYGVLVFGLGFLIVGQDTLLALASGKQQPELAAGLALAVFGGMILFIPLMLASIFAPTLVSMTGESAFASLYKGFRAGLKNWSAFLVNGLVLFLVSGGVGMVAGLFFGLAIGFSGGSSLMAILLIGLAALLLFLPLFAALSIMPYTASRDIFYDEA